LGLNFLDLLQNVLKSKSEFWKDHPDLKREVVEIFEKNRVKLQELDVTQKTAYSKPTISLRGAKSPATCWVFIA
jgi:hypothetical protein